ncbi:glycoside hydrolase family 3 C-terminal domain-containing protein [Streptomyces sp. NBC_00344]|uniref:glycoside hydrolase family 3 C-terminal domain-containing protein n=1 Tax=Streptomyces sp. NBC_00344 TaxID=2975720 RepID=UPI002E1A16C1
MQMARITAQRRRWRITTSIAGSLVVSALLVAQTGQAAAIPQARTPGADTQCPWIGAKASADSRAGQVVSKMTLDEKIATVHGAASGSYTGEVPGNARLCIPALKMQDGPTGVRMNDTTQLPAATGVAASFDPSVAKSYGQVIGEEDRTKGVDVDLGPTVNIVRDPRWGRAFESYSEDPYLTGQIGSADINGIQSRGVMAQVKHWAVYNQETKRNTSSDNVVVDDRTVREIYTDAFGTIVDQSHPSSAMCSYSWVNGTDACENAYLNDILKKDFGFDGFITSDWGGTHSTVAAANAGMDMQMPNGSHFGAALKTAVQKGQVPQSRVDDMVTRILREEFRFGLFDHPSADTHEAMASTPDHVAFAKKAAEDGTVLLKNEGNVLPLDTHTVHSIAVIGDGAGVDTMSAGGGSAAVAGTGTVTPYQGIKTRAGSRATVAYAQGNQETGGSLPAVESAYLTPPSGNGHGLQGDYYAGAAPDGKPLATQTDPQVAFNWNGKVPAPGVPSTNFAAKWTGSLTPPTTGTYTFGLTSDDGSRLFIGGKQVIDNWRDQGGTSTETAKVELTAGTPVQVEIDYYQSGGGDKVNFGWTRPGAGTDPIGQAVRLAADSDVAVVYANDFESEGSDLSGIDLPGDQNALIEAVAAANANTVVVLNTGSAVTMPWLNKVKGVLEAWYPGQESGNAIAALLFGDVNPSGKLPVTFPKSLAQVPASTTEQWPGVNGQVQYSEGLNVGYRWYDKKALAPLYPFGYGLSYTSYRFSKLRVEGSRLNEDGSLRVSADVTNTGRRAGSEVAQLYLGAPASTGEPARQLKGFRKVHLKPGQTRTVTFELTAKDASYWNETAHAWTLGTGTYGVRIGDSSRNLPLSGAFRVDRTTGPRYTAVTAPATTERSATLSVRTTFTNRSTQPVHQAATTLTTPSGWSKTASTPSAFKTVPAGGSVSTKWTVEVPADAKGGKVSLTGTTTYKGSGTLPPATGKAAVRVAFAGLPDAFGTVGVSDDADPTAGNLDGKGYSFSAQALAEAGITPGAAVGGGPAAFTWPDVPAARPDAVTAAGQLIAMKGSGSSLSFLGAGTNGTQSGPVVVTYTDGSSSTATLTFADWYSNAAAPGGSLVATTDHWNRPAGSTDPADHKVSLYSAAIPLTQGKQVAYVSLPDNAELHLFAGTIS